MRTAARETLRPMLEEVVKIRPVLYGIAAATPMLKEAHGFIQRAKQQGVVR